MIYSSTSDGLDRKCRALQQATNLAKGHRIHIRRTAKQGDHQSKGKLSNVLAWTKTEKSPTHTNTEFTEYNKIFRVLKEWCKPKQNQIASFTKLRDLRQGSQSLTKIRNTAQLFVQECKYP